jgi:hypothetical protein
MSSKEIKAMTQHTDSTTLVYYQYGNRDQLDALFIPYVSDVLGPTFGMFDKSVCFKNRSFVLSQAPGYPFCFSPIDRIVRETHVPDRKQKH